MPAYYLDTSALLKRYIAETGSAWIGRITNPLASNELYTASLTGPEAIAAISRRARNHPWSPAQVAAKLAAVRFDWQNVLAVIEIDADVIFRAMQLAETYGLRGADAVHLAAALTVHALRQAARVAPLTFVSADVEQRLATASEGLTTDDPNLHR